MILCCKSQLANLVKRAPDDKFDCILFYGFPGLYANQDQFYSSPHGGGAVKYLKSRMHPKLKWQKKNDFSHQINSTTALCAFYMILCVEIACELICLRSFLDEFICVSLCERQEYSTGFVLFLFFHEITCMKYLPTFCRRSTGSASVGFIKQKKNEQSSSRERERGREQMFQLHWDLTSL